MELLILAGLILLNGLFAMAEIAVVAARTSRLQERADRGETGAQAALKLKAEPNRFFSTLQIGITLIGTLTGAVGGAAVADNLALFLARTPVLAPYARSISLTLIVIAITYFTLIFGELTPKRLALTNPEGIAVQLAPLLAWLARWTAPLVKVLTFSTQVVLRLLGARQHEGPPVTEEEIRLLMLEGTEAGVFAPLESEMVEGVLRMGEQRARTVMTPRHEIVWLNLEDPLESNLAKIRTSGYSRFPVCEGQLDDFLGLAYTKDLLARQLTGQPLDLRVGLREPLYIPEGMPLLDMLERFRSARTHAALVLDEYGSVEGLITMHDLVEDIAGDIRSAGPTEGPSAVQRADGSWLLDGDYTVNDLEDLLALTTPLPNREFYGYETVAGLVLALLDHIPTRGECVAWDGWLFEVVDMDGLRVDQILVTPLEAQPPPETLTAS